MTDNGLAVRRIVYIAVMTAIMEAAKIALNPVPNVELITLLVILFTKQFGWKMTLPAVLIFAFIECTYWGFGTWSIVYFYMWPLLVFLTHLNRKAESVLNFAVLSAAFGLTFGAFCSVVTLLAAGLNAAFAWWIAGIPYDLIHGISNFIICLLLFRPLNQALEALKRVNGMSW
jgi:energy-coupling factor transport system substrate-specific component